jgi:hypothetical protein
MSTAKKMERSRDTLIAASEHLYYEVRMFNATSQILTSGALPEGIEHNAMLESFAMHARALLQFFIPTNPHKNDVLAEHYFGDPLEWKKLRGGLPQSLRQISERVAAEIVHLTYSRLDVGPEARRWDVPAITGAINELVTTFLRGVHHEYLGSSWRGQPEAQPTLILTTDWALAATNAFKVTMVNSPAVNTTFKGISTT